MSSSFVKRVLSLKAGTLYQARNGKLIEVHATDPSMRERIREYPFYAEIDNDVMVYTGGGTAMAKVILLSSKEPPIIRSRGSDEDNEFSGFDLSHEVMRSDFKMTYDEYENYYNTNLNKNHKNNYDKYSGLDFKYKYDEYEDNFKFIKEIDEYCKSSPFIKKWVYPNTTIPTQAIIKQETVITTTQEPTKPNTATKTQEPHTKPLGIGTRTLELDD